MMETVDDCGEVDVSAMFQQEASDLVHVHDLESTLNKFGYSRGDRIERRELVLMYKKVEREMEAEISRLAHSGSYADAKEMRARLSFLRSEFDSLQLEGARSVRNDQAALFDAGSGTLLAMEKERQLKHKRETQKLCELVRADLSQTHQIQRENCEMELSRVHMPSPKYSKRLIELFKAEAELIKLCQYEDARKVRNMIQKILPREEEQFRKEFERQLERKRRVVSDDHEQDLIRLDEKLKSIQWNGVREREKSLQMTQNRMKFHKEKMDHMHLLESKLRPEMTVKPSALWQKRKGHQATSASYRGQQLVNASKGKSGGDEIFADTLVDKHNFDEPMRDTISLGTGLFDDEDIIGSKL